jgi:hypothetical protein
LKAFLTGLPLLLAFYLSFGVLTSTIRTMHR